MPGRRSLLLAAAGGLALAPQSLRASNGPAPVSRAGAAGTRFSFALIGDLPYRRSEVSGLPALLDDIAAQTAFAIHVGDIKGGSEPCSDALLESRIAALSRIRVPLLYTPGDNEWTDCWRPAAGEHDPIERLDWLRRKVFEAQPPWLGDARTLRPADSAVTLSRLERQRDAIGGPPENLMWRAGSVLFLTLNLPGSDNGRRSPLDDADRIERDTHNRRWLNRALELALHERLPAIAVAVHANPGFGRGIDASRILGDDGYAAFRHDLARINARFPGHLLLMHGDTHHFRVDRILPRLTRVECFGSPFTAAWVRIDIDVRRNPPFEISVQNSAGPRDGNTP